MKATKLVTSAAVATLGLTLLAPSVLAAPGDVAKTLKGNADITFTENTDPVTPVDPEKPDPVDPPGPVNPEGGPLGVNVVTDLHFKGKGGTDTAKIELNGGEYFAGKPVGINKDTGAKTTYDRGNWVQITDSRAVDKNGPKGWKLSARLSKQFVNADGQELTGAKITYMNPVVTADSDTALPRTDLLTGSDFKAGSDLVLAFDKDGGGTKEMLVASQGKGFGTYFLQFGRGQEFLAQGADDTTASSVKLDVPANLPIAASQYNAEITWSIDTLN